MLIISEEIGIARIHKQCFQIMLAYIMCVGFLQPEQVVVRNIQFVWPVSFPDIFLKFLYGYVQVDKQVGLNERLPDNIV